MVTIAKRYAKALQMYAEECQAENAVYQQMLALQKTFQQMPHLGRTMNNPVVGKEEKRELLEEACGKDVHPVLQKFLNLIVKNKRENQLVFIVYSYIDLYHQKKNIIKGKLTTATPVTEDTLEKFKKLIKNPANGSVELDMDVNEDIIGGFILQVDSLRMDASVANQLQRIKKQINESNR